MAKKVFKMVKLQVKGGAANPSPPVGPALGSAGVNIRSFVNNLMEERKISQVKSFL